MLKRSHVTSTKIGLNFGSKEIKKACYLNLCSENQKSELKLKSKLEKKPLGIFEDFFHQHFLKD
jgi:hypothetical protein